MDAEALNDWATVTRFKNGNIGFVVQEPEITDEFRQFLIIIYGSNWEKRILGYQTMIIEQFYALINGYGELTSLMKRARLNQFSSSSPSQLRAHLQGLAESGRFLETDLAFGYCSRWRGINLRHTYVRLLCQCCVKVRWKLHKIKNSRTNLSH